MEHRVLIVDDERDVRRLIGRALGQEGYLVAEHASGDDALDALKAETFDVVVTDLAMPGLGGLELCALIVRDYPDIPVIIVTAHGTLDSAVTAIRTGAFDYITKPFSIGSVTGAIERAVRHRNVRTEVRRLSSLAPGNPGPSRLVGSSPSMLRVHDLIRRVAPWSTTVLFTGESGTGKELAASELHRQSPRATSPFVPVNCAAIPESLLESELFGHIKGSFTDAHTDREGLFEQARGGTIFLDEIGELPLRLQPKLLRVLQERTFRPVGGRKEIPLDVRIVAATNHDLEKAVRAGRFREDLFYRLNVVRIELPPLRERGNDVLLLAQRLVQQHARRNHKDVLGISSAAADKLVAYKWPGNVRELQNCIESAVVLTRHDHITAGDLPRAIRDFEPPSREQESTESPELPTLEELERTHILRVLHRVSGNKAAAARILGLNRKTLYRRLARLGIDPDAALDA